MNKTRLFLIVQSFLCVLVTMLLAAAAIGIYREGSVLKMTDPLSWVYTREKVAEALGSVLPVLAISLMMNVVGLFLGIRDENEKTPARDTECRRDLIVSRVAAESTGMKAERSRQRRLLCGGWTVFVICMIPILLYVTDGKYFPNGNLEPVFLALVGHVLPWVVIGLAVLMIFSVLQEKSMLREIEAAKEQIEADKASGLHPVSKKEEKKTLSLKIDFLRATLVVLAAGLIILGVFNGGARDVFGKAVKICTECVGLG